MRFGVDMKRKEAGAVGGTRGTRGSRCSWGTPCGPEHFLCVGCTPVTDSGISTCALWLQTAGSGCGRCGSGTPCGPPSLLCTGCACVTGSSNAEVYYLQIMAILRALNLYAVLS